MAATTMLRMLRTTYGIRLRELAVLCGTSSQYISAVELGVVHPTAKLEQSVTAAMTELIAMRKQQLASLEQIFSQYEGRLLQPAQEDANGTYRL